MTELRDTVDVCECGHSGAIHKDGICYGVFCEPHEFVPMHPQKALTYQQLIDYAFRSEITEKLLSDPTLINGLKRGSKRGN